MVQLNSMKGSQTTLGVFGPSQKTFGRFGLSEIDLVGWTSPTGTILFFVQWWHVSPCVDMFATCLIGTRVQVSLGKALCRSLFFAFAMHGFLDWCRGASGDYPGIST